jgi:hypothetical protein
MTGYRVSASRSVPAALERAFDVVLTEPLPRIFSRRYGPIPPIREVSDQTGDVWGTVGQSRRIVLSDGGSMTERLTTVDRPGSFGYRISDLSGPFKALISGLDGEWTFGPAGTGTRITWSWTLYPASSVASYALPVFARLWRGYARQALEEVEKILV